MQYRINQAGAHDVQIQSKTVGDIHQLCANAREFTGQCLVAVKHLPLAQGILRTFESVSLFLYEVMNLPE
jgi:hypothetical protein